MGIVCLSGVTRRQLRRSGVLECRIELRFWDLLPKRSHHRYSNIAFLSQETLDFLKGS